MARTQEHDAEFDAFVHGERARLLRLAYLVCGDRHQAEDVVQNALSQVYSRWTSISGQDGHARYVHRAVVNAAIDDRRRPWRREYPTGLLPDRATPPEDGLTLQVVEALAALPRRQRAVVVLRYVEDLDVESTAELLGISTGTVKSQAARGLNALRALLERTSAQSGHEVI